MGKNTSISLGSHFEDFINTEIATGRYNSASEVIRSALRLLEEEKNKTAALRQALDIGEQSGQHKDFDPEEGLKDLHAKYS